MAVAIVITLLFLLPSAYVLSVGPAVWLADNGYVENEGAFRVFYAPLIYLHETVPTARWILDAYVDNFEN